MERGCEPGRQLVETRYVVVELLLDCPERAKFNSVGQRPIRAKLSDKGCFHSMLVFPLAQPFTAGNSGPKIFLAPFMGRHRANAAGETP